MGLRVRPAAAAEPSAAYPGPTKYPLSMSIINYQCPLSIINVHYQLSMSIIHYQCPLSKSKIGPNGPWMVHLGSNLVGMNPNPFLDTSKTLPGPFYPIFGPKIPYWGPFGSHLGALAAIPLKGEYVNRTSIRVLRSGQLDTQKKKNREDSSGKLVKGPKGWGGCRPPTPPAIRGGAPPPHTPPKCRPSASKFMAPNGTGALLGYYTPLPGPIFFHWI